MTPEEVGARLVALLGCRRRRGPGQSASGGAAWPRRATVDVPAAPVVRRRRRRPRRPDAGLRLLRLAVRRRRAGRRLHRRRAPLVDAPPARGAAAHPGAARRTRGRVGRRPVPGRGLARAGDARDVRHRLRPATRTCGRCCCRRSSRAIPLRKEFVLAVPGRQAVAGREGAGRSPRRRRPSAPPMRPPGVPDPNEWGPLKGTVPPAPRPAARPASDPARPAGERPARPGPLNGRFARHAPRRHPPRRPRPPTSPRPARRPTCPAHRPTCRHRRTHRRRRRPRRRRRGRSLRNRRPPRRTPPPTATPPAEDVLTWPLWLDLLIRVGGGGRRVPHPAADRRPGRAQGDGAHAGPARPDVRRRLPRLGAARRRRREVRAEGGHHARATADRRGVPAGADRRAAAVPAGPAGHPARAGRPGRAAAGHRPVLRAGRGRRRRGRRADVGVGVGQQVQPARRPARRRPSCSATSCRWCSPRPAWRWRPAR